MMTNQSPNKLSRKVLSVFDFDGTLTRHDSFVPFLKFAFGTHTFIVRMMALTVPGLRYLTNGITRDELKAILIATFLTGAKEEWVKEKAVEFSRVVWTRLMRPTGLTAVAAERESGAVITLCSASPELWTFTS